MPQASAINSDSYWDGRFSTDWESCEGPRQSRFFARMAMENLPSWLLREMRRHALSVADWGCAQGDGTDVLGSHVDPRQLAGIDFSAVAIEQAKSRYPAIRFAAENWLDGLPRQGEAFDIVFSSNTLEHFHAPWEVLKALGRRAGKALVLALPYRELDRIDEHFYSFLPANVPRELDNGFQLVWSKVIDCTHIPDAMWSGEQILLVYADPAWLGTLRLTLGDWEIGREDTASTIARLHQSLAERAADSARLEQAQAERDALDALYHQALAERDAQGARHHQALAEHDAQIALHQQALAERDAQLALHHQKLDERDAQIVLHSQTLAERDAQITLLQRALVQRDEQSVRLQQEKSERDARIAAFEHAVAGRDTRIAAYEQALAERNARITAFEQAVAEHDARTAAFEQALAERDAEITLLQQAASERGAQSLRLQQEASERNAALQQALTESEQQNTRLHKALSERESQGALLHRAIAQREAQIASLHREAAEQQTRGARLNDELFKLSDWAQQISSRPASYAVKKTALRMARGTLRATPLPAAAKQRLRNLFLSVTRPLRRSARRQAFAPAQLPAPVQLPGAQDVFTDARRAVFVFAVIDWHFRIQRPQHMARSLAEAGRRVFYFSNHFVDAHEPGYQLEQLPGAAALYQIRLHVSGAPAIYFAPPSDEALAMLKRSMAQVMADFGALSSVSIAQHAYWYPLIRQLPNSYRIYDCMDHHEGFGNMPRKLVQIEHEMLRGADLVTVTSSWLEDFARKHNPNVALVRNAADYAHFSARPEVTHADARGRRIIGYYGAIAEWFDLSLLRAVALGHPDCLVLLVGNDTVGAQQALADLPNVEFTGEVPYDRLPGYLHAFDVCLLPFQVIALTLATNPVKVYEYLAAGKPVVCVDLPEVAQFGAQVASAASIPGFVARVGEALAESGPEAERRAVERRAFAFEQTWRHRGQELEAAIEAVRMPRVSVIVLTFNNLHLTRDCIDSVLARSDYPNLEVIVVDNASSDGTPQYLQDLGRSRPDVQVMLNRRNLGFAAGNNVGLARATGDYLVVLNNDTVVTQGWVMTMLRHFQDAPELGLLGPVTNNIGNEARIDIGYTEIADMPRHALRHTLAHMGQRYPMRNVAFFCAMWPRSTYERCGAISEEYGLGFFEDDDYCRKVEAEGLAIACADDVFVHHHLSASFSKMKYEQRRALVERNRAIYERKWGPWIPHVYRP